MISINGKDLDSYTIDELKTIIDEQSDDYSEDEMEMFKKRYAELETKPSLSENIIETTVKPDKSKKAVYAIGILIIIVASIVGSIIFIRSHNSKLSNDSYHLARKAEFDDALRVADKIVFDERLEKQTKNQAVACSYLFDCKRALENENLSTYSKWFGDKGKYEMFDCHFYQLRLASDYADYPNCVLSCLDLDDHEYHYLFFDYDSEKKHYRAHDEVIGLEQDLTPDKQYSVYSDEKPSDILDFNMKKKYDNALRTLIETTTQYGTEVDVKYPSIMWAMVSSEEIYKNAPLLDGYSTYHLE